MMTKSERLLRELIALPSVNPAFASANDSRVGEQCVAEFLAATAARAGLEVDFQKVLPGRSNLLARLRPRGKPRQRLLLAPHMDTVPAALEAQFIPRHRAGRLYGRGACDTKGSIAAMLSALVDLADSPARPAQTEIMLAALVDEECNQAGSRALVRSGLRANLAIVGEPTRLQIVTAHKGDLWLRLETHGKAAHGSRPELGRNAVHLMARIVDLLETRYAQFLRRRKHAVLGCATVNVGSISGGRQPNIVPDLCAITLDRRTLPGEKDAEVKREILRFLRQRHLRAKLVNAREGEPARPMETDPRQPLVRQFLGLAGQTRPAGVHFFSDAGVLAAGGIPAVVFGPGDIAQAHTAAEWVPLAELERARSLLQRFLQSLP